ncbi:MAG: MaoC family dehydratase N-terminal domain-containing protein [Acidimicrobiaceae bacterium]|nr:MaoC family dehydratase N-terminal domain-containing protein [Acidimicrobiaceae bacterium]
MTLLEQHLEVGHTFSQTVVEDLSRTEIVMYAGASGDFNPLHHDEVFVRSAGYPGVFAHGMLVMGLTGKLLTDTVGDGNLLRFGGRFTNQVWPGDTLTAEAVITEVRTESDQTVADFSVTTKNQKDEVVFSGQASARVAGP